MKQDRTSPFYHPGPGPVPVILDTDIGPDCDDAGAVAVLHALQSEGRLRTLAMMHCTSSRWGAGCLDALNIYYGRGDIPIGTLPIDGFLDDDSRYAKYNKLLASSPTSRYPDGANVPEAPALYRQTLAQAEDGTVVIVAIGPLINLLQLMETKPDAYSPLSGIALIARKVSHLVIMGGYLPEGKEWNFEMHPEAAAVVSEQWPTPITFTGYEIGLSIQTGSRLLEEAPPDHPVRMSYEAYLGQMQTRPSWDLTAVLYAATGADPYWSVIRGRMIVNKTDGSNHWINDVNGPHAYLEERMPPVSVAELLDDLMIR